MAAAVEAAGEGLHVGRRDAVGRRRVMLRILRNLEGGALTRTLRRS